MKRITPITGFGKTAVHLSIDTILVDVEVGDARVSWSLRDDLGVVCNQGNLLIEGDEYAKWGSDDAYIVQLLAKKLEVSLE